CDYTRNRDLALLGKEFAAASNERRRVLLPRMEQLLNVTVTPGDGDLIVIRGDHVGENPLRFLWKPYLPWGKLVHGFGNSSQAKSPAMVDIGARVTTGANWPDNTANTGGPQDVMIVNMEDDLEDTTLPRFRLAGGDKERLHYIKGARIVGGERSFSLET